MLLNTEAHIQFRILFLYSFCPPTFLYEQKCWRVYRCDYSYCLF